MYSLAPAPCLAPVQSCFEIGGRRFETDTPGLARAIGAAHATHLRPRCLCQPDGVEMYVARLGGGYIVKRMPSTGGQHASGCQSFEPMRVFPGLEQATSNAAAEGAAAVATTSMPHGPSNLNPRRGMPSAPADAVDPVSIDETGSELLELLHCLWHEAELTRWHPGFAGKRTWATVRRRLLMAAESRTAHLPSLNARLYIPEMFSVEHRDAINARRLTQWAHAASIPGKSPRLLLMIGEVKAIVPARCGYKAVIKHVPNQAFVLDEHIYRQLGRRFATELSLWGASDTLHMVAIATFDVNDAGVPTVQKLSLMPVTGEWLPIDDAFDGELVSRFVHEARNFAKVLRYNLSNKKPIRQELSARGSGTPRDSRFRGFPRVPCRRSPSA